KRVINERIFELITWRHASWVAPVELARLRDEHRNLVLDMVRGEAIEFAIRQLALRHAGPLWGDRRMAQGDGIASCRQIARTRLGPTSLCRGTVAACRPSALRHFECLAPSPTLRTPCA